MKKATKKKKRKKVKTKALTLRKETALPAVTSIDCLIQLALREKASLEQLDKLMQMKYRHEEREARKDFFQALSEFQANVGPMLKKGNVNYKKKDGTITDYNYAPLGQIEKQIKGPMAMSGLSKRFSIKQTPALITVGCVITHINGHSVITSMDAPADGSGNKNTIQSFGSTVTYLQRYTLIGALGLVTADADNDGQTVDPKKPTSAPEKRKTYNTKPSDVLPPEKPKSGLSRKAQEQLVDMTWRKMKAFNPDKFTKKFLVDTIKFVGGGSAKGLNDLKGGKITALIRELENEFNAEKEANENGK